MIFGPLEWPLRTSGARTSGSTPLPRAGDDAKQNGQHSSVSQPSTCFFVVCLWDVQALEAHNMTNHTKMTLDLQGL